MKQYKWSKPKFQWRYVLLCVVVFTFGYCRGAYACDPTDTECLQREATAAREEAQAAQEEAREARKAREEARERCIMETGDYEKC